MRFHRLGIGCVCIATLMFWYLPGAEAAQGVGKNGAGGKSTTVTGTIASINNSNGSFVLRGFRSSRVMVMVNGVQTPVVNRQPFTATYQVSPATVVVRQDGTVIGVQGIRPGLRARVTSDGNHLVSTVQVYTSNRSHGYVNRGRYHSYHSRVYHPRVYHQQNIHRPHSSTHHHASVAHRHASSSHRASAHTHNSRH